METWFILPVYRSGIRTFQAIEGSAFRRFLENYLITEIICYLLRHNIDRDSHLEVVYTDFFSKARQGKTIANM